MSDRVYIFDTTLRDGEQSPGCSMTVPEKLQHGAQAGGTGRRHPGSRLSPSPREGDFEAVDAVSREFPWVQVAALARCCTLDVERAAKSLQARPAAAHPHLHRHQRHSPEVQAEEDAAAGAGRSRGGRRTGAALRGRRRVLRRRRRAHRSRITWRRSRRRWSPPARAR